MFTEYRPLFSDKIFLFAVEGIGCYQFFYASQIQTVSAFGEFLYYNAAIFGGPIASLIFYRLAVKKVKETIGILLGRTNVELRALLWYPAVMFIMLVPYIIFDVLMYIDPTKAYLNGLFIVVFATLKSLGLVHAIIYGVQRRLYWNAQKKSVSGLIPDENDNEGDEPLREIDEGVT